MFESKHRVALFILVSVLASAVAHGQRQMEKLGRGVLVLRTSSTQTYIGWRLLGNDPEDVAFNLYRSANGAAAVKVNAAPITTTTNYVDTPANLSTTAYTYSVRPVLNGVEVTDTWANQASGPVTLPANAPQRQYVPVPIVPTPDDAAAGVSYDVKFCWVGDFDGDGEYDFLIDRTNPSIEAKQWLQAYKRDGTLLWQMDMGSNSVDHYHITPGSSSIGIGHGDNVTVYDMDGDGMAEVMLRTANGVVFANGSTLVAPDNEVQYISVIDGLTGTEKARATLPIPASWVTRTHVQGQMGIVYADGVRPTMIFHASNRNPDQSFNRYATAWDYRSGVLTQRWTWMPAGHTAEGHQIRMADVDNDGKDEFVDIGNVVKSDGSGQINGDKLTEVVHGDRYHLTDIDPDRPGLETFLIQQNNPTGLATMFHSADKASLIKKWYAGSVVDVGRGTVGAFVPNLQGLQFFSTVGGTFDCKGNEIYAGSPFPPETIWWDENLSREFVATIGSSATSPGIDRFNTADPNNTTRVLTIYSDPAAPNSPYNNYIAYGGRPQFWGDILGDWREELICVATDNSELRIYTTKTPDVSKTFGGANFRIYTLMHNPQYRDQATTKGYVQSSYVDYYLGYNMPPPPPPPMVDAKLVWKGGAGTTTWDAGGTASWLNNGTAGTFANGDSVRFDISGDNTTTVALNGTLQPGTLTVYSPKDYTFAGSGTLAGTMKLMKSGAGTLTLSNTHSYTGKTTVWDGGLVVNGSLSSSPVTVWGGTWGGALAAGKSGGRLAGKGMLGQPVTIKYRGSITPGSGMNNAGTLTCANGLTAENGSTFGFDLSNDPSGTTTANDRIVVTGNLSLSGTVSLVINPLAGQLAPGTYTLLNYTGTLTGSASNLAVIVPDGTPYSVSLASGALTLTVPVARTPGTVTWSGAASGAWDLANSVNWKLAGSPDVFVAGDTVAFDDTGSARPSVTLNVAAPISGLTFSGTTNYSISGSGSIAGGTGLTKSGSGTVTIGTTNTFTGPVTINGGVLAVDNLANGGDPSSIGASSSAASNFVINGGTLRLVGAQTNSNRAITLGAGGGVIDTPVTFQLSGAISGSGSLTKTGTGTFIIASANTYTGGTILQSGTLVLSSDSANTSGLGTGGITLQGGTFRMYNDTGSYNTSSWPITVPAGASARFEPDGRCTLSGTLSGSGTLEFYTNYVRTDITGNWSAFSGTLNVTTDADGGDVRFANSTGLPAALLNVAASTWTYTTLTSSTTIPIGALSGAGTLAGIGTAGKTVTWQIGAKNLDTVFSGPVTNGSGTAALTKVGTGTMTLSGACSHTGATTVSAGRLRIDGSTTGSNFTVQNGATLGGIGGITGNVAIQTGGALELNATPLAITGNLTFSGAAVIRAVNGFSPVAGTYTVATYTGTLTGTPTFTWEPPSGSSLTATFDTATTGQIQMTLTIPPRGPGPITWTGANSFDWDTTTSNWSASAAPTTFQTGDTPSFTDSGNATSAINIPASVEPVGVVVSSSNNYTFSGAGAITGAGTLVKSGTGTLTISAAHTFTGGSTINAGNVAISNSAAMGAGSVTLNGGTWNTDIYAPTNAILVTADSTISGGQSSGQHAVKNISGSGVLTLNATSVFDLEGDISGFSGTFALTGVGSFRFFNATNNGSSSATFDLGNRALSARSGSAFNLGALVGLTGSSLGMASNSSSSSCTYTIGGKNIDSTFAGVISNGGTKPVHIVKTGTGNLVLSGANTYTGTTAVSAGKLTVNGSLAATTTTVAVTGTLGGSGTLGGAVTCNGALAPGSGAGTLTFSSGLVLSSTSILDFELGTASDKAAVTGNLTLDGTVNITAASGFNAGTYTLATYTGTLTNNTLNVGTVPNGYSASVNTSTAGQVKLVVVANNLPPQIAAASLSPSSNVTTTTTAVAVTATDDAGEANLTYAWSSTGPAAVSFSPNGNNAAKSSTATFTAPGNYTFTVIVTDGPGLTSTTTTSATVVATPATLTLDPPSATVPVAETRTFAASVADQFGNPVSNPALVWNATGAGGVVSQSGVYTATAPGGPWQVSATSGPISGTSSVTVIKGAATVTLGNLTATYDGSTKPVSVTTSPQVATVNVTYNGSSVVPSAPGTYAVSAVVSDPNYAGSGSGSLVISPRSFTSWESANFTPTQITAGLSALDADPDGDGLTNLAEYALGAQPLVFTAQPAVTTVPGSISITFQRPAHIGDITYFAEASAGIETWEQLSLDVLNPGSDPETVRATRTLTEPRPAKQFLRLRFVK